MNKLKLAACGTDCNKCAAYKVTMEKDLKEAEKFVEWYRGQGWIGENEGAEAVLMKNPICTGCWNITDDCFWKCGCGSIDFRICCEERKINHCGECDDFPCEHYKKWVEMTPYHEKAMDYLLSLKIIP
ncbi:MAG: DUF3795 domain-containing protein [Oscillospiraceae bacterium]|nr:DUF3795 domain-containing protein [Oscillospiraceae bacterium]